MAPARAARSGWKFAPTDGIAADMYLRPLIAAATLAQAGVVLAAPGGQLDTLPRGNWQCATPGLAGTQPLHLRADLDFKIVIPSSYIRDGERGTYLLTGDRVVFTSGKLRGARFQRVSGNMLRELSHDGQLGEVRCVLLGT